MADASPSFWDSLLTDVASPGLAEVWNSQDANEQQLIDRYNAIIANPNTPPDKIIIAQRELAKFTASRQDPSTGNAQLFVDTASKAGKEIIDNAGGFVAKTIPWWVWAILLVGGLSWLAYTFSPFLRAKGYIK